MDFMDDATMETNFSDDDDDDPCNLLKLKADIEKYVKEYDFMYLFPSSHPSFRTVVWASENCGDDFGSFVWKDGTNIYTSFEELDWSVTNKKALSLIRHHCFRNASTKSRGILFTNKGKHDVLGFFASVQVQFIAKVGRTALENIVIPSKTVAVQDLNSVLLQSLQQKGVLLENAKNIETTSDFAICKIGDLLSQDQVALLKSFGHTKINQFKVNVILFCSTKEGTHEQLDDKDLLQTLKSDSTSAGTVTVEALDTQEETLSLETPIELRDSIDELKALVDQYERVFLFSMENRRDSLVEFVQRNMKHHKILTWKNKLLQNVLGRTPELEIFKNIHKLAVKVVGDQGLLLTNKSKEEVQRFFGAFDLPIYEKFSRIPSQTIQLEPGSLNEYPLLKACPFHFIRNKLPIHIEGDNWWLMRPVLLCQRGVHLSDFDFKIMELFRNEIGKFKMRMDYMWTPDGTFVDLQAEKKAENTEEGSSSEDCDNTIETPQLDSSASHNPDEIDRLQPEREKEQLAQSNRINEAESEPAYQSKMTHQNVVGAQHQDMSHQLDASYPSSRTQSDAMDFSADVNDQCRNDWTEVSESGRRKCEDEGRGNDDAKRAC